jgi:hypothetical protein
MYTVDQNHKVQGVAKATFWRTFHHDGKITPEAVRRELHGDLKCREVKTGFCRKRQMQTGSSETLIGWCGTTWIGDLKCREVKIRKNHVCPSMGPNGGSVAVDVDSGWWEWGCTPTPCHYIKTVRYLYSRAPAHCSGSDFRVFLFWVTQISYRVVFITVLALAYYTGKDHSASQSCVQVYIALYSDNEYILPAKNHRVQSAI